MVDPHIIERIRKCLALGESPNEHEAQQAIMMAQRLALKHGISLEEVKSAGEEPKATMTQIADQKSGCMYPRYMQIIAEVLADNFRVYSLYSRRGRHYEHWIIGMPDDVAIYRQVFGYTTTVFVILRDKCVSSHYRENRRNRSMATTNALQNDYLSGFAHGLQERFRRNVEEYALVVAKPQPVEELYASEFTGESFDIPCKGSGNSDIITTAYNDARTLRLHTELGA